MQLDLEDLGAYCLCISDGNLSIIINYSYIHKSIYAPVKHICLIDCVTLVSLTFHKLAVTYHDKSYCWSLQAALKSS